jgi:hypothetical protein
LSRVLGGGISSAGEVGGAAVLSALVCFAYTASYVEHHLVHSFAVALRHAHKMGLRVKQFTLLPVALLKSPPNTTIDTHTLHTILNKVKYPDVLQ